MLTLHLIDGRSLADGLVSIGMIDPHPPGGVVRVYDFGLERFVDDPVVISAAEDDPARVTFAPVLQVVEQDERLAANRPAAKVVRLPTRRRPAPVPTTFVSGYDVYARDAALFWRDAGVGDQPLLAAGVFALSSIQTSIVSALKLFTMLTPHVVANELPPTRQLRSIVRRSGAGLDDPKTGRPRWYRDYSAFRGAILGLVDDEGLRDDSLRHALATGWGLPLGLGLAKLSFTLALIGQNLGCLDARIIDWAFTKATAKRFVSRIRKRPNGTYAERVYGAYRRAELSILTKTPFYDPDDPVALARSQWMLWESLGPETARTHSHEELFEAVVDPRLLYRLGA